MVIGKIYLIGLTIAFVIHNIEECLLFNKRSNKYLKIIKNKLNNFYVFLYATILLDFLVILIFALSYIFLHKALNIIALTVAYGLLINAIQHLCGSFIYKKLCQRPLLQHS